MKQTTARIAFLFLLTLSVHVSMAGMTYTVTSNGESWATLTGSGTFSCPACIIIIPSGDQLNLNTAGECDGCTFESAATPTALGGTLNISNSFTLTNGSSPASTLKYITVDIAVATTFNSITATNDSFQVNANLTLQNVSTIANSSFDVAAGLTLSTQGLTIANTNFALATGSKFNNGGSAFTASNVGIYSNGATFQTGASTATFSNSTISLTGASSFNPNNSLSFTGGSITMSNTSTLTTGSSSTFTNATITMNNTSSLTTKATTLSGTDVYMNDNTVFTDNPLTLENDSYFQVGTGSSSSMAHLNSSNTLTVDDNSSLYLENDNNYFQTSVSSYSAGTIPTGHNCGGTYANACASDVTYGCATFTKTAVAFCTPTPLALAALNLTAVPAGTNAVALAWSDPQYSTADHYLVQRSSGNGDWTTLTTIAAGGYSTGDYQFEDQAVPAGTIEYRIARVGQDGSTLYSSISTLTITNTSNRIGIYPNPATGHTFFITVPNTDQQVVNLFTLTGQLVMRTTIQGSTQYSIELPSQLQPGTTIIVQTIGSERTTSLPLLLR